MTYRICLGLQRADRAVLEHGIETGIIKRLPHGEFIEVHQPLAGVDAHGHPIPLAYQGAPVPKRMNQLGFGGSPVPGSLLTPGPGRARPWRWSRPGAEEARAEEAERAARLGAAAGGARSSARCSPAARSRPAEGHRRLTVRDHAHRGPRRDLGGARGVSGPIRRSASAPPPGDGRRHRARPRRARR